MMARLAPERGGRDVLQTIGRWVSEAQPPALGPGFHGFKNGLALGFALRDAIIRSKLAPTRTIYDNGSKGPEWSWPHF